MRGERQREPEQGHHRPALVQRWAPMGRLAGCKRGQRLERGGELGHRRWEPELGTRLELELGHRRPELGLAQMKDAMGRHSERMAPSTLDSVLRQAVLLVEGGTGIDPVPRERLDTPLGPLSPPRPPRPPWAPLRTPRLPSFFTLAFALAAMAETRSKET